MATFGYLHGTNGHGTPEALTVASPETGGRPFFDVVVRGLEACD